MSADPPDGLRPPASYDRDEMIALLTLAAHHGPGDGEVVEVLGINRGAAGRVPLAGQVVEGERGRVAGVVPALEGDHDQGPVKGRALIPMDQLHALDRTATRRLADGR